MHIYVLLNDVAIFINSIAGASYATEAASSATNEGVLVRVISILIAYSLTYLVGVITADKEYNIAYYTLTPFLRKLLFFNRPRFTLVNIISQVYFLVLSALSVVALIFPLGISPSRVGQLYIGLFFWSLLIFQIIIVSRRRHW